MSVVLKEIRKRERAFKKMADSDSFWPPKGMSWWHAMNTETRELFQALVAEMEEVERGMGRKTAAESAPRGSRSLAERLSDSRTRGRPVPSD